MNTIVNYKEDSLVCQIRKLDYLIQGVNVGLRNELSNEEIKCSNTCNFDEEDDEIGTVFVIRKTRRQSKLEKLEKEFILKKKVLIKELLSMKRIKSGKATIDGKYSFKKVFSFSELVKRRITDTCGNSVEISI